MESGPRRGKNCEAAASGEGIHPEVRIEGENTGQPVALRDPDQGTVGEIHGRVPVLAHQGLDWRHVLFIDV